MDSSTAYLHANEARNRLYVWMRNDASRNDGLFLWEDDIWKSGLTTDAL